MIHPVELTFSVEQSRQLKPPGQLGRLRPLRRQRPLSVLRRVTGTVMDFLVACRSHAWFSSLLRLLRPSSVLVAPRTRTGPFPERHACRGWGAGPPGAGAWIMSQDGEPAGNHSIEKACRPFVMLHQ
jgi:hypothetical protein